MSDADARAHQRLLREFVVEHLSDGKPLRAFEAWETGTWSAA
jgi:DNA repair protein RecO (recombination protein O)